MCVVNGLCPKAAVYVLLSVSSSSSLCLSNTDSSQQSASEQVKFYTMNRRSKKTIDPTSKIAHNVDVDSRLRDAYSQKLSPEPEPAPITSKANGILPGPRSTRGESTENQATQSPADNTTTSSTPPASSSTPQQQQHLPPKRQHSESALPPVIPPPPVPRKESTGSLEDPVLRKESTGSLEDPNDYFLLRQRSVSETTVQRGNSRPINLVKTVTMPWGGGAAGAASMAGGVEKPGKTPAGQSAQRRGSTPVVMPGKHGNSHQDPQLMPTTSGQKPAAERRPSREGVGSESGRWYQAPPTPTDDKDPRLVSPPYDTLSRSDSGMSSERLELGMGIQIHSLKREDTSNSMDDFHIILSSPPLSPLYDHLPTTSPQDEGEENVLTLSTPVDSAMRRNVSQPIMISGRSEGGAPRSSTSPGPDSIAEEDEESEDDSTTRYVWLVDCM